MVEEEDLTATTGTDSVPAITEGVDNSQLQVSDCHMVTGTTSIPLRPAGLEGCSSGSEPAVTFLNASRKNVVADESKYYCCKKNGGSDTSSISQPPFPCGALSPLSPCELPGASSSSSSSLAATAAARRRGYCPTCSPYDSPFYVHAGDEMLNGGDGVSYVPTHYENQALAAPLPALPGSLLREPGRWGGPAGATQPGFYTNTRAISTQRWFWSCCGAGTFAGDTASRQLIGLQEEDTPTTDKMAAHSESVD
ncbi:hypothetical protein CRUP_034979 [Coryphaenoides rupestris]|nr:hypothetical protein CRUP_034979 [Coryphaenoides rupestris]